MSEKTIPVYSIPDLAESVDAEHFEIGDLGKSFRATKKNVLDPHRHDNYELFWVKEGSGKLIVDFNEFEIIPPMILLFSPGRVHGWRIEDTPEGFVFRLSNEFFALESRDAAEQVSDVSVFCSIGGDPVIYLDEQQNKQFETISNAAYQEFCSNQLERSSALRSYVRLWLVNAHRAAEINRPNQTQTASFYLTRRFLLLVEKHFREGLAVKDFAERLKVTSNHLSATLKETIQRTPGEVLRERLIIEAKRLLRYSDKNISDIAFDLNFEDPSYFARYFRKYNGQSPSDFRDSATNKKA
ncbi:MAG: helix-turn-helix domain-containing protein [Pyrinomonadaceae bacterium]|nr:helix-turn-helix domain-containing protein [Pyrinomonadaceae bacterium]